jgi:hypothetical protein
MRNHTNSYKSIESIYDRVLGGWVAAQSGVMEKIENLAATVSSHGAVKDKIHQLATQLAAAQAVMHDKVDVLASQFTQNGYGFSFSSARLQSLTRQARILSMWESGPSAWCRSFLHSLGPSSPHALHWMPHSSHLRHVDAHGTSCLVFGTTTFFHI